MLFSTPFFLFVFAPLFFLLYWRLPWRSTILLAGSLIFYGWSEPIFAGVVVLSAWLDWWLSFRIASDAGVAGTGEGTPPRLTSPSPRRTSRRKWLIAGVGANLALLLYTKYAAFAVVNLNVLLTTTGASAFSVPHILLPLGISFIVFEKITYLVDIYRGIARPAHRFKHYLNYVFLFPKLLAGPIVKYHDIDAQLDRPTHCYEDVREGLLRFLQGLAKKVLLADTLATTADAVFALPADSLHPGTAWLGLICFTLQIYFDFSGYSDMAIGMARILGFRLLENFRHPYLATSFTDFWKRWHISLSTWIKEYLYIPLGGNRVSTTRIYANLCICFLLSGLWHGASWNFVLWGCVHGVMLVLDRAFWLRAQTRLLRVVNVALTFFLVMLSWVFFRSETFSAAMNFFAALFGAHGSAQNTVFLYPDTLATLFAGIAVVLWPVLASVLRVPTGWTLPRTPALACALILLLLCIGRMSVSSFQPFLYFRF